ncbi:MAG: SdiA-regulated domain-containing protein [Flavobacteriaceae bacterium]|nr:SdiA-regulated domain-containing protein [Flavobacteriaceae bacterium]
MVNYLKYGFFLLLISCVTKEDHITEVFKLPKNLKEISGITYDAKTNLIWTLEDSGNENKIYALDKNGQIERTVTINQTDNVDWEDITLDSKGDLYIGDFGNNDNTRTDLCIYKLSASGLTSAALTPAYKVSFYYPEQTDFPPKKKALFYDCEAFFEFKNNFYLFTKNRSKGFDGTTFLYKIPNTPGTHKATLMGSFITCNDYTTCAITSAAISQDEKKIVLLGHSKVWLFENFVGDDFLKGTATELELHHYSQKEAVCFKDAATLLIADEKTKKIGGKLYQSNIATLKSKP